MTSANTPDPAAAQADQKNNVKPRADGVTSNGTSAHPEKEGTGTLMPPSKTVIGRALGNELHSDGHKPRQAPKGGVGTALTDTPISTAPPSPQMCVLFLFQRLEHFLSACLLLPRTYAERDMR